MSYYNKLPIWLYMDSLTGDSHRSVSWSNDRLWSLSGNNLLFGSWSGSDEGSKIRSRTGIKKRYKTEANNS